MKWNPDLFWELCREYGVELSSEYDTLMLKEEDGSVREFTEVDIDRIFGVV